MFFNNLILIIFIKFPALPNLVMREYSFFDVTRLLINLSYGINLIALLVKEILWLRSILIIAQAIMITYGIKSDNVAIFMWNSLFFAINLYRIIRLVLDKREVEIPEELEYFHKEVFANMNSREFLYFWQTAQTAFTQNGPLCFQGEVLSELILIVDGEVSVKVDDTQVAILGRGAFVAEMSFLTHKEATATVLAIDGVNFKAWSREKLADLKKLNPHMMIKLQEALGKDLAEKLSKMKSDDRAVVDIIENDKKEPTEIKDENSIAGEGMVTTDQDKSAEGLRQKAVKSINEG